MDKIPTALWGVAEAMSKAKAYLVGNGMDKVLSTALETMKSMPDEVKRDPQFLTKIMNQGIIKEHVQEGKKRVIRIKLESQERIGS